MRVAVDCGGYASAAGTCRTANQISALLCESLAGKLAGYVGMAGDDSSSVEFAASYDEGAREAVATLAELIHAFVGLGSLLSASGANHRDAEAASAGISAYAGRRDFVQRSPARALKVPDEIDALLSETDSDAGLSSQLISWGFDAAPEDGERAWLVAVRDRVRLSIRADLA